jgi:CubicO group peptidase (beta-lactamase class C family)
VKRSVVRSSLAGVVLVLTGAGTLPAMADGPSPYVPSGIGTALPAVDLPPAQRVRELRPSRERLPETVPWGAGTMDLLTTPAADRLTIEDFLTRTSTRAFVVLHRGRLVAEWYADGVDAGTRLASWSVAKSMVSLLADQAVQDGRLTLRTRVVDVLPQLRVESALDGDAAYNDVTVRDLLDMTSGIDANEGYTLLDDPSAALTDPALLISTFTGTYPLFVTPDVDSFAALHRRMVFDPGTAGEYISFNSQLLGMVVEAAYGEDLVSLFRDRLWEPAGAEHAATWNLDRPDGTAKGFCCLNATGRDFARLGQLVLDAGTPRSPVSRRWKERLLRPRAHPLYGGEWPYSTNFWHVPADLERGRARLEDASAIGIFGQYVYVNDRTDTVIAKLSDYGIEQDEELTFLAMRSIAESFA